MISARWLLLDVERTVYFELLGSIMELLTTKQAAKYLGVSMAFLERDRWAGAQVPFVRIGSRTVRYLKSDLEEYIRERRCTGTVRDK